MSFPFTYENYYRVHDTALMNWVKSLHVDYNAKDSPIQPPQVNVPIISVFASPDRAFAQALDLLTRTNWITTAGSPKVDASNAAKLNGLPLPLVSIQRGDDEPDHEMEGIPKRIGFSANNTTASFPLWKPRWIPYELTFWGRKTFTDNYIREWILGQLGTRGNLSNEVYIDVIHTDPWGVKRQSLQIIDFTDESDLEGRQIRFKRVLCRVRLRGWLTNTLATV